MNILFFTPAGILDISHDWSMYTSISVVLILAFIIGRSIYLTCKVQGYRHYMIAEMFTLILGVVFFTGLVFTETRSINSPLFFPKSETYHSAEYNNNSVVGLPSVIAENYQYDKRALKMHQNKLRDDKKIYKHVLHHYGKKSDEYLSLSLDINHQKEKIGHFTLQSNKYLHYLHSLKPSEIHTPPIISNHYKNKLYFNN